MKTLVLISSSSNAVARGVLVSALLLLVAPLALSAQARQFAVAHPDAVEIRVRAFFDGGGQEDESRNDDTGWVLGRVTSLRIADGRVPTRYRVDGRDAAGRLVSTESLRGEDALQSISFDAIPGNVSFTAALPVKLGGDAELSAASPNGEVSVSEDAAARRFEVVLEGGSDVAVMQNDFGGSLVLKTLAGAPFARVGGDTDFQGAGFLSVDRLPGNVPGFIVEGRVGSSESSKMEVRGSGEDAVFDMSKTGDLSVQLPTDALNLEEIQIDTGIAHHEGNFTQIFSGLASIASRSITPPESGHVVAFGNFENTWGIFEGNCATTSFALSLASDSFTGRTQTMDRCSDGVLLSGGTAISVVDVFPAEAEVPLEVHLLAEALGGANFGVFRPQLTLLFVPTVYGDVDGEVDTDRLVEDLGRVVSRDVADRNRPPGRTASGETRSSADNDAASRAWTSQDGTRVAAERPSVTAMRVQVVDAASGRLLADTGPRRVGGIKWPELDGVQPGTELRVVTQGWNLEGTEIVNRTWTATRESYRSAQGLERGASPPVRFSPGLAIEGDLMTPTGFVEAGDGVAGWLGVRQNGSDFAVMSSRPDDGGTLTFFHSGGEDSVELVGDINAGGGGFLRIDHGPGFNPGFQVDGNKFGSTATEVEIFGTSNLSFDTSKAGNDGVDLPIASITHPEVRGEFGIAHRTRTATISPGSSPSAYLSRTIDLPGPGTVWAIGTITARWGDVNSGDIEFGVNTAPDVFRSSDPSRIAQSAELFESQQLTRAGTTQEVFEVASEGPKTFYLLAARAEDESTVFDGQLTLLFVPEQFGVVGSDPE